MKTLKILALATLIAPTFANAEPTSGALPLGFNTISGDIRQSVNGGLDTMKIDQISSRPDIQWDSFNLDKKATVNFNAPNESEITLNRVSSGQSHPIANLNSTGPVIYIGGQGPVIHYESHSTVNSDHLQPKKINYPQLPSSAKISGLEPAGGNFSPELSMNLDGIADTATFSTSANGAIELK
jgi:filamentous hemagglutinin family protein